MKALKDSIDILKSARDNAALQNHISTYEKKKLDASLQQPIEDNYKCFNKIYNKFISNISKYFDDMKARIKEIFERNGDYALTYIEKFILDINAIHHILILEPKFIRSYYLIGENIRGHVERLQRETDELFFSIDHNSGIPNYRLFARSLACLKYAKWIDLICPNVSDNWMHDITDELATRAQQLEIRLIKLNLAFKYSDNICEAREILKKIQAMRILGTSIPELKNHIVTVFQHFLQSTELVFDYIKKKLSICKTILYLISNRN